MQEFKAGGEHHSSLWLVNNSPVFSVLPGGIVEGFSEDIPIYLKVGNPSFGEIHIRKHLHWIRKQQFNSVAEFVYHKLGQPGEIYCTEEERKLKILMRLNPAALLVMVLFERPHVHLSITTIYILPPAIDGQKIGRYPGRMRSN